MNVLQGLEHTPARFLVTLNHRDAIDESRILRSFHYAHPVYTPAGVAAQSRHRELNGVQRTYFCGAYWRSGFHEDGVVSAQTALAHFDADLERAQLPLSRVG
jgi:predicted NAD/FAD-binding protein